MPEDKRNPDKESNRSDWLVIPYFSGDRGDDQQRPLPRNVTSWNCPSIIVNNLPGVAVFVPGEDLTVNVTVRNFGNGVGVTPVIVTVWWMEFTSGASRAFRFGQETIPVSTRGGKNTASIHGQIPISAPSHICLVARASTPTDQGGSVPDPIQNRHWGQLNLHTVPIQETGRFEFEFWAGNPLPGKGTFEITVREANEESREVLSSQVKMRLAHAEALDLSVGFNDLEDEHEHRSSRSVTLNSNERVKVTVRGILSVAQRLDGSGVPLEALLVARDHEERIVGSAGVVLVVKQP